MSAAGRRAVPFGVTNMYIDPSAGSIILQVAVAAAVGGMLTAKRWWGKVKQAFRASLTRIGIR